MALTGFSVNGICAADSSAAMQAASLAYPQIVGSVLYSLDGISSASAPLFTLTLSANPLPSGTPVSNNFTVSFLPCDPTVSSSSYFDGMQMGWGVVAAMAAAASIIYLKNAFFR